MNNLVKAMIETAPEDFNAWVKFCGAPVKTKEEEKIRDGILGLLLKLKNWAEDEFCISFNPHQSIEERKFHCEECGYKTTLNWNGYTHGLGIICPSCGDQGYITDRFVHEEAGTATIDEFLKSMDDISFMQQYRYLYAFPGYDAPFKEMEIREELCSLFSAIKEYCEKELGMNFPDLGVTEVTEHCSHCDRDITLSWSLVEDGLKAYCPHCGNRLMLCTYCSYLENGCDYDEKTDTCRYNLGVV